MQWSEAQPRAAAATLIRLKRAARWQLHDFYPSCTCDTTFGVDEYLRSICFSRKLALASRCLVQQPRSPRQTLTPHPGPFHCDFRMTTPPPASAQARLILDEAFVKFERTVAQDDHRVIKGTQLQDVRDEAIRIEKRLRDRHMQRNMIRIEPFLRGIEHYSKVMEVLCNGTPYLSWVWAPVKLMLMVGNVLLIPLDDLSSVMTR